MMNLDVIVYWTEETKEENLTLQILERIVIPEKALFCPCKNALLSGIRFSVKPQEIINRIPHKFSFVGFAAEKKILRNVTVL